MESPEAPPSTAVRSTLLPLDTGLPRNAQLYMLCHRKVRMYYKIDDMKSETTDLHVHNNYACNYITPFSLVMRQQGLWISVADVGFIEGGML